MKHFAEATKDLQQALELEPDNKAFAKELDQLQLDVAEHRKQRAVLKQLDSNNSSTSALPDAGAASSEQSGSKAGPDEPVVEFEKLITQLQTAGTAFLRPQHRILQ